jgi:hypothetical protein
MLSKDKPVSIEENYLTQVGQIANGVTAFSFAQNLTFAISVFSIEPFRREIICARPTWVWAPVCVSLVIYGGMVASCLLIELLLLQEIHRTSFQTIAVLLAAGRLVAILLGSAPMTLAMLAVRDRDRTNRQRAC